MPSVIFSVSSYGANLREEWEEQRQIDRDEEIAREREEYWMTAIREGILPSRSARARAVASGPGTGRGPSRRKNKTRTRAAPGADREANETTPRRSGA